jgi:NAD(P)H-flavin reductase
VTGANPMLPVPAQVQRLERETHDTFSLQLATPSMPFEPFRPGQFSMIYVPAVGELPISVSGDPDARYSLTYTVRSVGKATNKLVTRSVGDWVGVRGHYGHGWPVDAARGKDIVIVAGGLGLAPLRPVFYHVFRYRAEFGRIVLAYGARSPRDILFRQELAGWKRNPDTQILTTVDYGGLNWRGNVGVVTKLLNRVRVEPDKSVAFVCGPEVMMRFAALELETRGIAGENIWLSLERNMKCAVGLCGHCQFGPWFVCRDGPVFAYSKVRQWLTRHEI